MNLLAQDAYSGILRESGFRYSLYGPWAIVREPVGTQGWKLHLSAIPVEVEHLLQAVLPYLGHHGLCFKIARDCTTLEALNSGALGNERVGKFMTVYPAPERARTVAEELSVLTDCFHGPTIPTDLRLGSVLYARYGGFSPTLRRDRLGRYHLQIAAGDGAPQDDEYTIPYQPPAEVHYPFVGLDRKAPDRPRKTFGPGYLLLDVLNERAKGSVFLALCLRSQEHVGLKALKQGRQYCMSDRYGRDVRWILQRELRYHRHLEDVGGIPRADEYFEESGDGYLVLDHVSGQSIESFAAQVLGRRPWGAVERETRSRVLQCLVSLLKLVAALHERGFVHRDLSNANVQVTRHNQVVLLDLEMGHLIDDKQPPVGCGTPGFVSPQQAAGGPADFTDDVYSACCVAVLALTGIDPRRVLFADARNRRRQLSALTDDCAELVPLLDLVSHGLAATAADRPTLTALAAAAERSAALLWDTTPDSRRSSNLKTPSINTAGLRSLLKRAVKGILYDVQTDAQGLWLSAPLGAGEEGVALEDLEPLRSAHTGVAGVVYVLARLSRSGLADAAARQRARNAVDWLLARHRTSDIDMPGLYFGEAGVAVALHEAVIAELVSNRPRAFADARNQLEGPLDWLDLTHGAAGQGIAALHCNPASAERCADFLIGRQEVDGSWVIPAGFKGLSGQKLTGFAHGMAGIVYFLAQFAQRTGSLAAEAACRAGVRWLTTCAVRTEAGALEWPYSDGRPDRWRWWCHGAPGIALTYLQLYEMTNESAYLQTAIDALRIHPTRVSYGNLSTCHGLSGLGEIYLEAFRVTGDRHWLERALGLLDTITALARETDSGGLVWLADDPAIPTADLGLGCSSVIHFLLRLLVGPDRLSFPLLGRS